MWWRGVAYLHLQIFSLSFFFFPSNSLRTSSISILAYSKWYTSMLTHTHTYIYIYIYIYSLDYCNVEHYSWKGQNFLVLWALGSVALENLRECLLHHFKQQFLVFKQYYTYFHTLFYPHISLHKFSNNKTHVFKCIHQTPPLIVLYCHTETSKNTAI